MFVWCSYGDVTVTGEKLHILTYARHSWQLDSEGSLAYQTYCDTRKPFIKVIYEYPWHTYCRTFSCGAVTTCFYDSGLSRLGFEYSIFRLRGESSHPMHHRRDETVYSTCILIKALWKITHFPCALNMWSHQSTLIFFKER